MTMKYTLSLCPQMLRAAAAVVLLLAPATPLAAQTVYDDFDDGWVNESHWSFEDYANLSESGGLHHITGPPAQVDANMSSTQAFGGDFEFVLDWRDLWTTATQFVINVPNVSLQIADLQEEDFVFIFRSEDSTGGSHFSNAYLGGAWRNGFSGPPTSVPAGLLKITRSGSTISTWYEEGSGWVLLGTFPNAFTGPASVQVGGYTGDNGNFHVSCDWVTYIGQEIFPRPDVKVNGLDGGFSVPAGSLVDLTLALEPNTYDGIDGDWWVMGVSSKGTFWNTLASGWVKSQTPIPFHTGSFFPLTSTSLFQTTTLPAGNYLVYFAIDIDPNGLPDWGAFELHADVVDFEVL